MGRGNCQWNSQQYKFKRPFNNNLFELNTTAPFGTAY